MKPENFPVLHKDNVVTNLVLSTDHYINTNLFEELANATWGRSWPDGAKKYTIDQDGWEWHLRNAHNSRQYFLIRLNFDDQQTPKFFTVIHAGGETNTRDMSISDLRDTLRMAYKAGPKLGNTTGPSIQSERHKWAQDIGRHYLTQFVMGNAQSYELELEHFPNLRSALGTLSMCSSNFCCSKCQRIAELIYATMAYGHELHQYHKATLSYVGICQQLV